MRVRGKYLVIVAVLVGAALTTALVRRDREPSYNGHSLSEWLHAARPGYINPPAPPAEATAAVRRIGTNALPTLLKWASYDPTRLQSKLRPIVSGSDHPADAEDGFRILGPVARPAIPGLTRLAIKSSSDERVMRCARCLASIGPDAVPALAEVISNYHGKERYYPIAVLAKFGTNVQPAVPVLVRCLSDSDVRVRRAATNALSKLPPEILANTTAPAH